MSPARRRVAVKYLRRKFKVSERRACRVVGQHRSSNRYAPVAPDFEKRLVKEMTRLSLRHPRYGYRRVHALLVADGWEVNVKRVERLWRREGLRVPARRGPNGQRAIGGDANSAWARPATRPVHAWSYDFVSLRTTRGAPVRVLNVVDEFTKFAYPPLVQPSIGAADVVEHLKVLFEAHGAPEMIRSDNGREFIAETVKTFLGRAGCTPVFIAKGRPQQNCYVERFNGSMRDEAITGESFETVLEARVVLTGWVQEYNHERPHRSLNMRTPAAFLAYCLAHPPLDGQCP